MIEVGEHYPFTTSTVVLFLSCYCMYRWKDVCPLAWMVERKQITKREQKREVETQNYKYFDGGKVQPGNSVMLYKASKSRTCVKNQISCWNITLMEIVHLILHVVRVITCMYILYTNCQMLHHLITFECATLMHHAVFSTAHYTSYLHCSRCLIEQNLEIHKYEYL